LGGLVVVLMFLIVLFVISEVLIGREVFTKASVIHGLEQMTERLRGLLDEETHKGAHLRAQVARLERTLSDRERFLLQLRADLATADAARQRQDQELAQRQQRLAALEGELRERATALTALTQSKDLLSRSLAEREAAYAALELSKADTERERATLEQQSALLSARLERMTAELERFNQALQTEREALAAKTATLQSMETATQQMRAEVRAKEGELIRSNALLAEQSERLKAMDRLLKHRLLERVEELEQYTSQFLRRLHAVFGKNPDIKVVGDRFVFQSEVLFPSGSATLSRGGKQGLDKFVSVYRQVADRLPKDLPILIQVIGYTDRVPPRPGASFKSNRELSVQRAAGVVDYLIAQGIPARSVAPIGMGEYYPVDAARTPEAYRRNRRIEIKIGTP
jgi:chemotaxis protein MotB